MKIFLKFVPFVYILLFIQSLTAILQNYLATEQLAIQYDR